MTLQEIEIRIETLKIAIDVNTRFLNVVPAGADKSTERQVEIDRRELDLLKDKLNELSYGEK